METLRIVFYHTKDILKGRGFRIYFALFVVSILIMLGMEELQLSMDVEGTPYMVASFLASLCNIVCMYIVQFLFIKAVRKEKFSLQDVWYGLKKSPILIVLGILLSIMQVTFIMVSSLFGVFYWLNLVLLSLVNAFFLIWNVTIAYGIYDGTCFTQLLSGGLFIMKKHLKEVFMAALPILIWNILGRYIVPELSQMLLGNTMYAGLILPGIIKGMAISVGTAITITIVNMLYYGIQYACMLPLYTYLAKLYNEERFTCMPSGLRFLSDK